MRKYSFSGGSNAGKIIAIIAVVLVLVIAIGFVFKFTNGFTRDFSTFYVSVDENDIMNSADGYYMTSGKPLNVQVKNALTDDYSEIEYKVKVIPNAVEDKDFDFVLDGEKYSFQMEKDLTKAFEIKRGEDGSFSVTPKGNTLTELLQAVYEDSEIENCDVAAYKDMFTLVISTEDEKFAIKIDFAVGSEVSGITLTPDTIIF